jgi:hypothetical protein
LKEEAKIHFYTMLLGIPWKVVKDWWIELSLPCHLPGYRRAPKNHSSCLKSPQESNALESIVLKPPHTQNQRVDFFGSHLSLNPKPPTSLFIEDLNQPMACQALE